MANNGSGFQWSPMAAALFGLVFLLVGGQGALAQATPCEYKWNGDCYATLSDAEDAMRSTDIDHYFLKFDTLDQDGNRLYDVAPRPHLPPIGWVTEYYDSAINPVRSPVFATHGEAKAFMDFKGSQPSAEYPNQIASDAFIYRGSTVDGSNLTTDYYSHNFTAVPINTIDVTKSSTNYNFCWPPYQDLTPEANIDDRAHYVYGPDAQTPYVVAPHIVSSFRNNCIQSDSSWFRIYRFAVFKIWEETTGYICTLPFLDNGLECELTLTETIEVGPFFTIDAASSCTSPSTTDRTNPCDLSNGKKLETETDYGGGGTQSLRFSRFYNSIGPFKSAENSGVGWRHSYSRALDERPDKDAIKLVTSQSSSYGTDQEACESGWDDIKAVVWGGDLSTATAAFIGGSSCEISSGGTVKAIFPVKNAKSRSLFVPATTVRTITRPNGAVYHFKQSGTDWINELNPAVTLEESGTDWIFTNTDDSQETYNSAGQLLTIAYRNGQTETLEYNLTAAQGGDDDSSTLDRVVGSFGHELTFAYDVNGRLESVMTPDGLFEYDYDGVGNLVSVTQPSSAVREYVYEDANFPSHLTGIIDENSDRFATWGYDSDGRAILSEYAGNKETVNIAYNPDGTTTLTLGNGATRDYTFTVAQGQRRTSMVVGDTCSACPGGETADRTYDSNGFLDEVVDWNLNTTQTVRNAVGLTETLIEAKGASEQRTTTTTWHSDYRIPTQIVSPKNTTDFTHDPDGNVLTVTMSSGALSRLWTMTYNSEGQPLTIDGPRTDVNDLTTIAYYTCTSGDECGQIHTITNALSQVTTYNSYDAAGRPTLITGANGLQTAFTYDWRGNVLTVVETPTVGTPRTTTMTYDDVGQLETLSTPDGMVLTYTYTAAHYLDSVTDNLGNSIDYDYDAMGNVIDEDTYDSGSTLKRAMDYAYDLNNRLDTVTNGGYLTDLSIDLVGNLTGEVDPELASTTHSYDALNRLDQTIDALTGVIDYGYDDHDNITSVTAANGATTTFEYDDLDNLKKEISADRGTLNYTYDEAGNRKTQIDARGKLTSYDYDALNRLTLVTFDDLSTIAYEYDVGTNAIGRLNKITDTSGTTTWSYDNFGAVTQKVQNIGAVALTTSYSYDTGGRLDTMTYPSGKVVTYTYNTYQQAGVSVDGNSILSGATYDPFGPVNGWMWGKGSYASRNFDLRGLTTTLDFASDTQTLGYDNAGQVTSQLDSNLDVLYDYDLLGRLTDFTNNNAGGGSPSGPMFSAAPVILANIQTTTNETGTPPSGNPTPWITTSVRNVGATSVQLALGRAEVNTGSISVAETVGYIAIQSGANGSFSANGGTVNYEAQTTSDTIKGWGNGCYTTNFLSSFSSAPTVVATINKLDGGDGGWARRCSLTSGAIGLTIDEDQFKDSERNHTAEAVGVAAFSQSFDTTFNDGVSTWGMEAESVTLPAVAGGSGWVSVGFRQTYATVPVVVTLATNETSDPAAIRIRNVTTTGFEAAQVEPANNDGAQGAMTMHYVAAETGTHELPDGTRVLVDAVSITNQQHGGGVSGSESWSTEAFDVWPGASGSPLPTTQVLTYDANSNRASLNEDSTLYAYSNLTNSNRILNVAGPAAKTYTYDLSGNVTGDSVHSYGYDDRGRLVDVDSGAATYVHNGQGQRVKKNNGAVTLFAYDEIGGLVGEYDSLGDAIQETVWFNGAPVAVLEGVNRFYVHTDQLGSPRVITDGNTVIWRWQSDPFGATAPDDDPDGDANSFTYNVRFPGQYFDSETGLHYNYHRTYDPSTGRYLESDPVGLVGGLNTYGYVSANPLSFTDPLGLYEGGGVAEVLGDPAAQAAARARAVAAQQRQAQKDFEEYQRLCRHFGGSNCDAPQDCPTDEASVEAWRTFIDIFSLSSGAYGTSRIPGSRLTVRPNVPYEPRWNYGTGKSAEKWARQMQQRGWTESQISEALSNGQAHSARNNINPANGATRYVHPDSGRSVVIDNTTRELIHVGGDGYRY